MALDPRIAPSNSVATVLIVEDNPNMLFLAERIVRKRGYTVLKASNGQAALDLYQQHRSNIEVVMLDMSLPTISGRDVLYRITRENPAAKVIVTSGYLDQDALEIERGQIEYLHKPYTPDEVLNALDKLSAREHKRDPQ